MDFQLIWNETRLRFHNLLFPLPARVQCVITDEQLGDPDRLDFAADVEVRQGDRLAAEATARFTAFDTRKVRVTERQRAERVRFTVASGGVDADA
jgi:hypothetical protein